MATISPEFVERYQIELQRNPKSRIFAPLSEAYRQMNMLDEAFKTCSRGVQIHPDFAGGRVALAKILIDRKDRERANEHLEIAVRISPDNLLAQNLLAENLLELRRPKDALNAFKMVLFLNPDDERAKKAVQKWEFLSADEYDDDLFKIRPVFGPFKPTKPQPPLLQPEPDSITKKSEFGLTVDPVWKSQEIERAISLADAFTVRNDLDRAQTILTEAMRELGPAREIDKRLKLLQKRSQGTTSVRENADFTLKKMKRDKLERLLQLISERRSE